MGKWNDRFKNGAVWLVALSITAGCASNESKPNSEPEPSNPSKSLEQFVTELSNVGRAYGATLAPDNVRLAYVAPAEGVPQVWVANTQGGEARQLTSFDNQVEQANWSPRGDQLSLSVAPGGGLNSQIYLIPASGGEAKRITAGGEENNWLGPWSHDGRFLTFSSNVSGDGDMDAYLYDLQTESTRRIAQNPGIGSVSAISPNNQQAIIWRMRSRGNTNLYLLNIETGREQLLTPHDGVAESFNGMFHDDQTVLMASNVGTEQLGIAKIDIDAAGDVQPLEWIAQRDDAEVDAFRVTADGRIAISWNVGGRSELMWIDLTDNTMAPGPKLPADVVSGLTTSPDRSLLAVSLQGSASPQDIFVLPGGARDFTRVTASASAAIDTASLVRPELLRYKGHDGLSLSGFWYQAQGTSGAQPVVVSFHGGPEGQTRPYFRSTFQALLRQGISVFAPNVRGSAGFGKTFVNLDNGELRFNAIKDIKSTTNFLVASGRADPNRLGIMGGSYGGYMVMAGLTEYPDLFGAGANLFGIVNFATFFEQSEPWMAAISTIEYGDPDSQAELLKRLSPIHKLDRVKAPTLVLHGANDTNVPVIEAEQVVEGLKKLGVPVEYVLFPDEGHGWRKTENRITSDLAIVRWFEHHLR